MKKYYKKIRRITKNEKRGRTSGIFTEVWQSTQNKNNNGSLMAQKKTKWSVHLEVIETQGYLCDIHKR